MTRSRVYQLVAAGALRRDADGHVFMDDVKAQAKVTHRAAMRKVGSPERLALLATGVRGRLHPPGLAVLSSGAAAIPSLPGDVVAALGYNCVEAAARPDSTESRWLWAHLQFRAHGGVDPDDSPVYRALFNATPCPRDRARWAEQKDALAASAETGARNREAIRREQLAAHTASEVQAARERIRRDQWIVDAGTARSVTASVRTPQTIGDPDGADLVAERRRKLRGQREAAVQRGDVRRVGDLNAAIRRLDS